MLRGYFYRLLMRIAHHYDWHHAKVIGPFANGEYQRWCEWCGFRQSFYPEPPAKWCCSGIGGGHERQCRYHEDNYQPQCAVPQPMQHS